MTILSKDARPNVELRETPDGRPNPKYVDVLEEDKPIAGQKYACVSFLSPEKILKKKERL